MPGDRELSRKGEQGHLMAGLMVAVAILTIFSTIAVQGWEDTLRRDKEAEMIFRAEEIVRGIYRHRKAHGRLPEKLEDLMEPGPKGEYLLRHRYKDPLVKGGKWGLLYIGPGGVIIDPNVDPVLDPAQGGVPGLPGLQNAGAASAQNPGLDLPKTGGFDEEDQEADGTGKPKRKSIVDKNQGPTGLNLAGVKSLCEDSPFRFYHGLTTYAEWRFTYDALQGDRGGQAGQGGQGRPGGPGAGRPGDPGAGRGNPAAPGSGLGNKPRSPGGGSPRGGGDSPGPRGR